MASVKKSLCFGSNFKVVSLWENIAMVNLIVIYCNSFV